MPAMPDAAIIVPYAAEYAADFERLNTRWITEYFTLEAPDLAVLGDPEGEIIAPGGQVYFALDGSRVIGTVAAIPTGNGEFELAKMAVEPEAQGRGVGRLLVEAVIMFAREAGAHTLILLTHSTLRPALHLYEKLGFRLMPLPADTGYARAELRMELAL